MGSLPPEVEVLAAFRFVLAVGASRLFFSGFLLFSGENWPERWTESMVRACLHPRFGFRVRLSCRLSFEQSGLSVHQFRVEGDSSLRGEIAKLRAHHVA